MNKYFIAICLAILIHITTFGFAQEKNFPVIGELMPAFALKTDEHNRNGLNTSAQLKGKHYILDFWNTGCGGCVMAFPKMDSLRSKFAPDLEIVLVGLEEKNRDAKKFYEVYRKKFGLDLPSFLDSSTFKRFVPSGVPHLIWVDDKGVVKAITRTGEVNSLNIGLFLENEPFEFEDVSYEGRRKDVLKATHLKTEPILANSKEGADTSYAFRTIFALWETGMDYIMPPILPTKYRDRALYQASGVYIENLFTLANFGLANIPVNTPNFYPQPQFSEGALEKFSKKYSRKQQFIYSVEIPYENATQEQLMKKMRSDLFYFFGLEGDIVNRRMPCYILSVIDNRKFSKIISNTGKQYQSWHEENTEHQFINLPTSELVKVLPSRIFSKGYIPKIDMTKCGCNVTFKMKADILNIESIRNGLKEVGLDLILQENEMNVLEITEGQQ